MTDRPSPRAAWTAVFAALTRQRTLVYLLGIIGWYIVLKSMPFDWSLPAYAEF